MCFVCSLAKHHIGLQCLSEKTQFLGFLFRKAVQNHRIGEVGQQSIVWFVTFLVTLNTSAKNYHYRIVYVKIIASQRWDVFLRYSADWCIVAFHLLGLKLRALSTSSGICPSIGPFVIYRDEKVGPLCSLCIGPLKGLKHWQSPGGSTWLHYQPSEAGAEHARWRQEVKSDDELPAQWLRSHGHRLNPSLCTDLKKFIDQIDIVRSHSVVTWPTL